MNEAEASVLVNFGKNLQEIREAQKLSLRELAALADVEHALIHRLEKGQTNPKLLTILRLAKALKISINKLMEFKA
jgi:transcriptional regulator with XRE-family HTH domain